MGFFRQVRLNPKLTVRQVLDGLRTSIWAAPTIGVVLALAGAFGLIQLDRVIGRGRSAFYLFDGGPESARELLSTIASSMLTFTALVFSITILVLQLASNQFSPRVIRTFLSERITKVAMAMFIATFVYAMAVLSQVRAAPQPFVPGLATWVALMLVLASVGVFIRYIHRMTHSVRAITIITKIAEETRRSIDHVFPVHPDPKDAWTVATAPARKPDLTLLHRGAPGVIAYVDLDQLARSVASDEATLEIVPRVGDFVPQGAELVRVWGTLRDKVHCQAAIGLDVERTAHQDPGFGFRQLVDIATRALSPGVNDPTTASQALDQLHDLVRQLTTRDIPTARCARQRDHVTLIVSVLDYAGYVRVAFEEIRTYAGASVQVRRRLEEALLDCIAIADPERRTPLAEELALLRAGVFEPRRTPDSRTSSGAALNAAEYSDALASSH